MKFLIVDDSKAMQVIVHKALVSSGYSDHDFEYACNGREALQKIHDIDPDIVLSDWHMPEMSGLELLDSLKKEGSNVKIGLVTTEKIEERVKEARDAGALFVVSKPFTPDTLHKAVEEALSDLETHSAPTQLDSDLVLPSERAIKKTVKTLTHHEVTMLPSENFDLDSSGFPFMVCLYSQEGKTDTLAVSVMDVHLASYLGASHQEHSAEEALIAIESNTITKESFDSAKLFLELLASHITDEEDALDVKAKGVHMVNTQMEKFQSLISARKGSASCYEISIEGYGCGRFMLLKH